MFPGRRGAGRIFYNEVQLCGVVPQVCVLFGPERGRRRLHPGVLRRRDHARRQRVDVPRLAAHGRDGHRREGHARGDGRREDALARVAAAATSSSRPTRRASTSPSATSRTSRRTATRSRRRRRPPSRAPTRGDPRAHPGGREQAVRHERLLDALVDEGSFLEIHQRWAKELIVGFARLDGRVVGIVANQPKYKGGVLFVDSADKAARFIWMCDAFNIPLLFLADVPGFMIGTAVERQGIIRHGAKMITRGQRGDRAEALASIVRKAYGAGLYAMAGPAFDPDASLALPTASIAVMGPRRRSTPSSTTRSRRSRTRTSARRSARSCGASTPRTSTSCTSRPSSSSTRSSSPRTCAPSWCGASRATPASARVAGQAARHLAGLSRRSAAAGQKARAHEVALPLMRVAALLEGGSDELCGAGEAGRGHCAYSASARVRDRGVARVRGCGWHPRQRCRRAAMNSTRWPPGVRANARGAPQ